MAPGSVSLLAEDTTHPSTVGTTWSTTCLLASRCVAPLAEELSATVCAATVSTATMDKDKKPTDDEKCLDEDNY